MNALASALVLLALAPIAADDPPPAGDLAKLQGTWTAKVGPNKDIEIDAEFKGAKVAIKGEANGNAFELKGEVKLDEKASPKTLDWIKFTSPQGDDLPDNLALYRLEGDKLTICSGGPGNERPTEMKEGENGPPNLVVFSRKKPRAEEQPKAKDEKSDLDALQGKWTAKVGPDGRTITMEIKGKGVVSKFPADDGDLELTGELALGETKSPRAIDFVKFKTSQGESIEDTLGIYKIEGDSFTLCVGNPGDDRPTEFKAGGGGEAPRLWSFTRPK